MKPAGALLLLLGVLLPSCTARLGHAPAGDAEGIQGFAPSNPDIRSLVVECSTDAAGNSQWNVKCGLYARASNAIEPLTALPQGFSVSWSQPTSSSKVEVLSCTTGLDGLSQSCVIQSPAEVIPTLFMTATITNPRVDQPFVVPSSSPATVKGFFASGTGGFYANDSGHYCFIPSWNQWLAMGGPAIGYPSYNPIPSAMIYDGQCALPAGFFANGTGGYYANASSHYCFIPSWNQWLAMGGPATGYPTFDPIPTSMVFDGQCALPAGFFASGTGGYYANANGHYCLVPTWSKWLAMGGPATGYPTFSPIPASMIYDGNCP